MYAKKLFEYFQHSSSFTKMSLMYTQMQIEKNIMIKKSTSYEDIFVTFKASSSNCNWHV